MTVFAPAKLNLSLQILGRREDGFHELETLMVPVAGLYDLIEINRAEAFELETGSAEVGPVEDNLVTKALRLFEKRTGLTCPYQIKLEKHIPSGAGLGGGSSDAAAILRALNELEKTALGSVDLEEMAALLGSDVPFFLRDSPCWCRGRGEILEETSLPAQEVVLLKPAFAVNTVDAYRRWSASANLPDVSYELQRLDNLRMVNDLERPAFERFPFLAELKMWLLNRPEVRGSLMSGSGATVFAILEEGVSSSELVVDAKRELDPRLWWWAGSTSAPVRRD
ncbi:MAG TPA: 4-(cytidine 5'-diphospho)-2-C-methyl-D-erythritol kinase [Verrucomicrobiales bacterium]|mgnify:FL=1|nr:4-(cytidine 5'-diphospho)-2-C-methyl-D-erythritol kinase [Verrucomicrobiales bacterium]|tara:strand:- start:291 stop:1133 length:843 start_codon:yes stop_codon:yes gene_type:complete